MKNWLKSLSRLQYGLLLMTCWAVVFVGLITGGYNIAGAMWIGAAAQYPAHVIFGRLEFGYWY